MNEVIEYKRVKYISELTNAQFEDYLTLMVLIYNEDNARQEKLGSNHIHDVKRDVMRDFIRENFFKDSTEQYVAIKGDKLIGLLNMATFSEVERTFSLTELIVDKSLRGHGVGSELFKMAMQEVDTRGYQCVLQVTRNNPILQFYIKNGFKTTLRYELLRK